MQYIQLQPQIASQVPTPANGSLNFFLDVETNYVQTKGNTGEIVTYSTITGGTYSDSTLTFFDNLGGSFSVTGITSGGASLVSVTYTGLTNLISTNGLTTNSSYLITDFRTCYDTPEYNINGTSKRGTEIDYKQGNVEPIIVLATSVNTISSTAYQPAYPKDRIQYDYNFSTTEVTGGVAYGRINERIDEYNNRTDYDHRNISFNRFQSYNKASKLSGVIINLAWSQNILMGNNTSFLSEVNPGDILLIDGYQSGGIGVKVVSAITDNELYFVTDSEFSGIPFCGETYTFYNASASGNYDEYKEVYVGQKNEGDWDSFTTFNLNGSAIHNYVGDYSKFYLEEVGSTSGFMLANNVFNGNNIYSNTIGDRSYNNTGRYWFVRNKIGGRFYNNTINQSGFYSNNIGEYFNDNIIKDSMYTNTIAEGFNNNIIEGNFYDNTIGVYFENNHTYSQLNKNTIGNSCVNNNIYSDFYDNKIGLYFSDNTIGDLGNLSNFEFYRNVIGNSFGSNNVRQDFQNNQIGNQFNNNTLNGDFYKNVIGNGFNDNYNIGYNFYGNHIGNGFNNNDVIGDYFQDNQIGEYFNNNNISYKFTNNQIGNTFENNTLGNSDYFNWNNTSIENLTGRTYDSFYSSLFGIGGENIGNVILGKELIMHFYRNSGTTLTSGNLIIGETYEITDYMGDDFSNVAAVVSGTINETGCVFIATGQTPTSWYGSILTELTIYDEYHQVKFTQWTQGNNGGGFSYERTKVYPTSEPTVLFTKLNYESKVDVIVGSRLVIARANNQAIYNDAEEGSWDENQSPMGTEWNSIYTQPENINGAGFEHNNIDNEFKGNYILAIFSLNDIGSYTGGNTFSGDTNANKMGPYTFDNVFSGSTYGNTWVGDFGSNYIGVNFGGNSFYGEIYSNVIGDNFYANEIKSYFSNNTIGNNFGYGLSEPQGNKIGNNFSLNTIGEYFYNNSIPDNFCQNQIGDYFQWNVINTNIIGLDFALNYGNITGFTYITTGTTAGNPLTTGVVGITNGHGFDAEFTITSDSGTIVGVDLPYRGKFYLVDDTITILGTQIGGVTPDDDINITVTGVTSGSLFYDHHTKQIFERKGGNKRVSYYDENDILNLDSIFLVSGYVEIFSQPLSFPINYASWEYWCDGSYVTNGIITSQTVNNMSELVALFNSVMGTLYFFDNYDGTLGQYISPELKTSLCPTGVLTLNVFND